MKFEQEERVMIIIERRSRWTGGRDEDDREGAARRPPARWPCSSTSCGPAQRCPGATGDELVRAAAGVGGDRVVGGRPRKLGVIREIMRARGPAVARQRPRRPAGDLVAGRCATSWPAALACSTQSAETTASLAWQLGARLPAHRRPAWTTGRSPAPRPGPWPRRSPS